VHNSFVTENTLQTVSAYYSVDKKCGAHFFVGAMFVSAVAPFKTEFISESILQRLIKQNVIVCFRLTDPSASDCFLYRSGKHCDYFIMILQGRVQVEFGKENMIFEGGPFVCFGVQALGMINVCTSTSLDIRLDDWWLSFDAVLMDKVCFCIWVLFLLLTSLASQFCSYLTNKALSPKASRLRRKSQL